MAMRLEPVGFWSYARRDSNVFEKLGRMRKLLQDELELQIGRDDVKIFQDIGAIDYGAEWERKLREAVADSTFFIPIVTPNYIQSEWCTRELFLFLEREKQLNEDYPSLKGERRIFPIYFVDIAGPKPYDQRALEELQRLQWFDFTKLRNKNYDSDEVVRDKLAELAGSMKRLLFREVEPKPSEEERAAHAAAAEAARERQARDAAVRKQAEHEAAFAEAKRTADAEARARSEAAAREAAVKSEAEADAKRRAEAAMDQPQPFAASDDAKSLTPRWMAIGAGLLAIVLIVWFVTRDPGEAGNAAEPVTDEAVALQNDPAALAEIFGGRWRPAGTRDTDANCTMRISFAKAAGSVEMQVAIAPATFTHSVIAAEGRRIETRLRSADGAPGVARLEGNIYSYDRRDDGMKVTRVDGPGGRAQGASEGLERCG